MRFVRAQTRIPHHPELSSLEHQKRVLDRATVLLNVRSTKDWYNVKNEVLKRAGGAEALLKNNNSLSKTLNYVYPELSIDTRSFSKVPQHFWMSVENQRNKFEDISIILNLKTLCDWYTVSAQQMMCHGASEIMHKYGDCISEAVAKIFPEYNWEPWQFKYIPRKFWGKCENVRECFNSASKELDIKILSDWYKISKQQVNEVLGAGILSHYGDSLCNALCHVFPNQKWQKEKFMSSTGYWDRPDNQRAFFDDLGRSVGISSLYDWVNVQKKHLEKASFILRRYSFSLSNALYSMYPEHIWDMSQFRKVPTQYWEDEVNIIRSLKRIEATLNVSQPEGWYNISQNQMANLGAKGLLRYFPRALQAVHPDYNWNFDVFRKRNKNSQQRWLSHGVKGLFVVPRLM